MRRSLLLLGLLLLLLAAPAAAQAEPAMTVRLNGSPLALDSPPMLEAGRTLVPVRAIFEALGAAVQWDPASGSVTAQRAKRSIRLTVDSQTATVDGRAVQLDVPARIIGERTYVPLRFVAEALGAGVTYEPQSRTVAVVDLSYLKDSPAIDLLQRAAVTPRNQDGHLEYALGVVGEALDPYDQGELSWWAEGSVAGPNADWLLNGNFRLVTRAGQGYTLGADHRSPNQVGYCSNDSPFVNCETLWRWRQNRVIISTRSYDMEIVGDGVTTIIPCVQKSGEAPEPCTPQTIKPNRPWQPIGPVPTGSRIMEFPGGFNPDLPLASIPLLSAVKAVTPGEIVGEEQWLTVAFDPAKLDLIDLIREIGLETQPIVWQEATDLPTAP